MSVARWSQAIDSLLVRPNWYLLSNSRQSGATPGSEERLGVTPSDMQKRKRLVLASSSSRRQDLLGYLGIAFETIPSYIEEITAPNLAPEEVAIALAGKKATAVSEALLEESSPEERKAEAKRLVVLGADTIVVCEDTLLGKPS